MQCIFIFFFSSRRRHTRYWRDWSSDVCSSDLGPADRARGTRRPARLRRERARAGARGRRGLAGDARGGRRSEEGRGGEECRFRWGAYHLKKKKKKITDRETDLILKKNCIVPVL